MHLPDVYDAFTHDGARADISLPRRGAPRGLYRNLFKRLIDVTLVLIAAPLVLPSLAILALIVARDGGNPFYLNRRVGQGGRIFYMVKLRSMVSGADALLEAHLANDPVAAAEWEHHQKLRNDPRITRFGAFLRKTSVDELPQLWNVLKGDMSLVGPRPMMPHQQPSYEGTAYYQLRPGLTGPWQVSDRHESAFTDRVGFDESYSASLSLLTDVKLILRTVAVVLKGTGC